MIMTEKDIHEVQAEAVEDDEDEEELIGDYGDPDGDRMINWDEDEYEYFAEDDLPPYVQYMEE